MWEIAFRHFVARLCLAIIFRQSGGRLQLLREDSRGRRARAELTLLWVGKLRADAHRLDHAATVGHLRTQPSPAYINAVNVTGNGALAEPQRSAGVRHMTTIANVSIAKATRCSTPMVARSSIGNRPWAARRFIATSWLSRLRQYDQSRLELQRVSRDRQRRAGGQGLQGKQRRMTPAMYDARYPQHRVT